jgi:hypothetical protein
MINRKEKKRWMERGENSKERKKETDQVKRIQSTLKCFIGALGPRLAL